MMRPARWATRSGTGPGAGASAARSPSWTGCARPTRAPWSPGSWPARSAGGWLPQASAAELVSCYGIPLVATIAAATEDEAAAAAAQLGGRVVLKAEAEGLVHRTDAGGVRVDLRTPQEVAEAYRTLAADFGPRLQRVLVQPMLTGGVEVHIGVAQEPVFGPLVVFGSGDPATEVPGDQVARLTPLTDADAGEMITFGARRAAAGRPPGHAAGGHRRARRRAAAGLQARR